MIKTIKDDNGVVLALIIKPSYQDDGIHFFTANEDTMQLAYMRHPSGKIILPHIHNSVKREVSLTKEVLVIKSGKLQVDFYTTDKRKVGSDILTEGDIILLSEGGHGFKVLEDIEMYEIKQGPYVGEMDKIRFEPD